MHIEMLWIKFAICFYQRGIFWLIPCSLSWVDRQQIFKSFCLQLSEDNESRDRKLWLVIDDWSIHLVNFSFIRFPMTTTRFSLDSQERAARHSELKCWSFFCSCFHIEISSRWKHFRLLDLCAASQAMNFTESLIWLTLWLMMIFITRVKNIKIIMKSCMILIIFEKVMLKE